MNQDFVAWMGQGPIADRTKEHLGESDRGVILFRKRMLEEAAVVARGGDPKAVVRDPSKNHRAAPAPHPRGARRARCVRADGPRPMVFHAGQPREIVEDMQRVWAERRRELTMATLAGVFNMSHSPFCYMPPEKWNDVRASRSLRPDVPMDDARGESRARPPASRTAFATLKAALAAARPDVLVVFGDDQLECFDFGNYPSFAIYAGASFTDRSPAAAAPPSPATRPWPRPCSPASCSAASIPPSRSTCRSPSAASGTRSCARPSRSPTSRCRSCPSS